MLLALLLIGFATRFPAESAILWYPEFFHGGVVGLSPHVHVVDSAGNSKDASRIIEELQHFGWQRVGDRNHRLEILAGEKSTFRIGWGSQGGRSNRAAVSSNKIPYLSPHPQCWRVSKILYANCDNCWLI